MLHATVPNASGVPRTMVTQRWMREDVLDEMLTAQEDDRDAA